MSDLKQDLAALRIEREPDRPGVGRSIAWIVLLVLVGGAGVGAWKWATRQRPIEVQVAVVAERAAGTQAAVLNASGYVTARRRATVSSKITGKVVEVNVEEGMAVREGQVLARLDDSTAKAALALAVAQAESARKAVNENEVHLAQARLTLNRSTELHKSGAVSQSDVDLATSDVDGTQARINALREQVNVAERQVEVQRTDLDNTIIRAPFSGIAISKDAQPGEMVSPISAGGGFTRTGICTVVDMRSLEIEVDVNRATSIGHPASTCRRSSTYLTGRFSHVITIVPTADRQKATVLVHRVRAADPRLLPDMGVKVTFLREEDEAAAPAGAAQPTTLVPKAAAINGQSGPGNSFVFVVAGEAVERRAVKIGGADGDRAEVTGGLRPGERVVVSPPSDLIDGAKVVVK